MTEPSFAKWRCQACGEIYDEALGSPETGVPAGTRFADLPDDWICPACGSAKAEFVLHVE